VSRLRHLWPYAIVTAAPLLLFSPFLLGLRVLYWGTIEFQFYPWQHLVVDALRAGRLPLWNPLLGNGAPLLANYQSAVLYPPNWLALLLPLDITQPWLAALHLAWAGAGMVTLARVLKISTLGQVIAGLSFGLSQYLVARVSFLSINATVSWLPVIVCLAEIQLQLGQPGAASQRRAGAALALALAVALQLLAGHAQTTWYTLELVAAWCGWRLLNREGSSASAQVRTALWLAAPIMSAGLLAGVQLLPTAELLGQSPRASAAGFDFVMTYSFSPWRLLTLAAPDLLGNPARGQYFGYGNYWEDAIYFGLLPLLLALGFGMQTLARVIRRKAATTFAGPHGLPQFLVALSAISLVLGLGRNTPVFPFLYWYVPTFNLFQAPTRVLIWLVFALALLAGMGVDTWRRPQGGALYWTRLAAAGAAMMAVVGLLAWLLISPTTQTGLQVQTMGRALALAGVIGFIAALLSLTHPAGVSWPWAAMIVVFVAADLLYADYGLNPGAPPDLYRRPAPSAQAIGAALGTHRLLYYPNDEYEVKYERFVSFKSFGPAGLAYGARDSLMADVSTLDGVATANNFEPLVSARYSDLMDVISATHSLPLLRLMDIAVIASPSQLGLEPVATSASGGVHFYRAPGVPQRIWLPTEAITVEGGSAAMSALADPNFDPSKTVVLENSDETAPVAPLHLPPSAAAVTIPVNLAQAGWVVLADTGYPGWVVTVDGRPAQVRHGDYAFRAVAVPPGVHTVVFDYQPESLRQGLFLTALGALLILFLAAWMLSYPSQFWQRLAGWHKGRIG
jgi:hypothetical protein